MCCLPPWRASSSAWTPALAHPPHGQGMLLFSPPPPPRPPLKGIVCAVITLRPPPPAAPCRTLAAPRCGQARLWEGTPPPQPPTHPPGVTPPPGVGSREHTPRQPSGRAPPLPPVFPLSTPSPSHTRAVRVAAGRGGAGRGGAGRRAGTVPRPLTPHTPPAVPQSGTRRGLPVGGLPGGGRALGRDGSGERAAACSPAGALRALAHGLTRPPSHLGDEAPPGLPVGVWRGGCCRLRWVAADPRRVGCAGVEPAVRRGRSLRAAAAARPPTSSTGCGRAGAGQALGFWFRGGGGVALQAGPHFHSRRAAAVICRLQTHGLPPYASPSPHPPHPATPHACPRRVFAVASAPTALSAPAPPRRPLQPD